MAFGTVLVGCQLFSPSAQAARVTYPGGHKAAHAFATASAQSNVAMPGHRGTKRAFAKGTKVRYANYSVLQCVPFARAASGIAIKGNAANWWTAAAGVYDRGNAPEPGSVLNFRSTGRMRLGHVAVVTAIDDPRHIEIEHANWGGPGSVSRNVPVEDVSASNDWTAVRVGLGHTGEYGSVYPTYGFIYDRPDDGGTRMAYGAPTVTAPTAPSAPQAQPVVEVAQAPDAPARVSGRLAGILDLPPSHGR